MRNGEGMNFAATLWIIGIVFLAAAVVGQAIKVLSTETPTVASPFSRIALALLGVSALVLGGVVYLGQPLQDSDAALAPTRTATSTPEPANVLPTANPSTGTIETGFYNLQMAIACA
jgi:hypothetical protein